jgi:hypothetical protein
VVFFLDMVTPEDYYVDNRLPNDAASFRELRWQLSRIKLFTARWLLHVPPGLTPTILSSAYTVYLFVLCGSENKPIMLLYSINLLVFMREI